MKKVWTMTCLILLLVQNAQGSEQSIFPRFVGKEYESFLDMANFYAVIKKNQPEGHAFISARVPDRVQIGESYFKTTNTQAFSVNLQSLKGESTVLSDIIRQLAKKDVPQDFVERGCWVAILHGGHMTSQCYSGQSWNYLTRPIVDGALEALLKTLTISEVKEILAIHSHPDIETTTSKVGDSVKLSYFGPSAHDLRLVKEQQYVLTDRGVNVPLTGIVVPSGQESSVFFYYFRPLPIEDPNYMKLYLPRALANGTLLEGLFH